jgi:hypothetical protein
MNIKDVQLMAKKMGITKKNLKKVELVRAIQLTEGNIPCFATNRVNVCGENNCLWLKDCLKANNK